ncbi:hypothetical protein BN946_scf184828.g3 [Trametes cinnabarina]|uniref:Methyltransferase n=1 Tax=Pycnoporus cinnabarinus TaxID=5643 RepID=A0A060SQD6_PYCCI|nr:hypothetical protein BN946_scf184828.g3 [Trametes cinnabarina]
MAIERDPNFPSDLDIQPLASASSDADARFDSVAQEGAIRTYGIAGRIWEASHAMLAYLDPESVMDFDPLPPTTTSPDSRHDITAIELGSGTGELGLQEVHATSRRYPTHILCSDLIYFPALLAPLLRSLLHLTSPPFVDEASQKPAVVILSYKMRSLVKETPFWTAFGLWFQFEPVLAKRRRNASSKEYHGEIEEGQLWTRFSPGDPTDETFVLVARRRPESLKWTIPEEDPPLLSGVGAYLSDLPKSDDQFEQLLLMGTDLS